MQKSTPSSSRSAGQPLLDRPAPGAPNTSATKRILRGSCEQVAAGWTSSEHVVARVLRVARERLLLDPERSSTVPELRAGRPSTGEPTVERRVGAQVRDETTSDGAPVGWMSMRRP